jgi:hypothetical protein
MTENNLTELARCLIERLERLSVDSHWAHMASGQRRSLLRAIETLQNYPDNKLAYQHLEELVHAGFKIVENGARDMGDPSD